MNDERVVVETTCGHRDALGREIWHRHVDFTDKGLPDCEGGERRTLTPGEYVLIERRSSGRWPVDVVARLYDWARDDNETAAELLETLASVAGKDT